MPHLKRATLLGVTLLAAFLTSACFEVTIDVTDQNVSPGDTITFTAVVVPENTGMMAHLVYNVYIEYPQTWTYMDGGKSIYVGGVPGGFSGGPIPPVALVEVTEAYCADGVTTDLVPISPRPGYRVEAYRQGAGLVVDPEAWGAMHLQFIVDGEPGVYPVRVWGGTQNEQYSSYPSCAWEEIPIHITMFADDFETGDKSAWS